MFESIHPNILKMFFSEKNNSFLYLCAVKSDFINVQNLSYMKKKKAAIILFVCLPLMSFAQNRNLEQMKQIAAEALSERGVTVDKPQIMDEMRRLEHCSVIANSMGGFAVVSADGKRVLGISTTKAGKNTNPGFEWWLKAINEALGKTPNEASSTIRPNPKKIPIEVLPMMTTHWGQLDPYNRELPYGNEKEVVATGCVATAMAQVLNYYKQPAKGEGQHTIFFPYGDTEGINITSDFGSHYYEWDLMLDDYSRQPFTDEQAHAVAVLMKDCGVAANMHYNVESKGGSGTTLQNATEGLRNFLGMPNAQYLDRRDYSDQEWMETVFGELATGHPLIYGGVTYSGGGHSFVVHGYDRYGLVYVNWGWNGNSEGYYNIDLLNPGEISFAYNQNLVAGLCPAELKVHAEDVSLSQSGTLAEKLQCPIEEITAIKVRGPINDTDIEWLRKAAIEGHLQQIDLSEAQIDRLPDKAFYDCKHLIGLKLPHGLKHIGDGAFANCYYLSELILENMADDADFILESDIIYNKEKSEIICALPTIEGELKIESNVTDIHPYAFAGCVLLKKIDLPATITKLHTETFRDCFWLEELRIRNKTIPALTGYNTFSGLDMALCTLYVPSGTKSLYNRKAQWKDFKSVVEFGTTVKAKNTTRKTGEENPIFAYEIMGDAVSGTPYLYTDATVTSPAGVYTIYVTPGTITAEDVEYVNGKLIVIQSDPSAILSPTSSSAPIHVYDLQGRKTTDDPTRLPKGMYVANGRKFVVK